MTFVTDATHQMNILKYSTDQEFVIAPQKVYQGANEKVVRKSPECGFVLALIVMALALVVAKYSRQHPLMVTGSVLNSADVDMRTSDG